LPFLGTKEKAMGEITGDIIATPLGIRPYRATVECRGKVIVFCDAYTAAEAYKFLDKSLTASKLAARRSRT
jgi:hypothetical protein